MTSKSAFYRAFLAFPTRPQGEVWFVRLIFKYRFLNFILLSITFYILFIKILYKHYNIITDDVALTTHTSKVFILTHSCSMFVLTNMAYLTDFLCINFDRRCVFSILLLDERCSQSFQSFFWIFRGFFGRQSRLNRPCLT